MHDQRTWLIYVRKHIYMTRSYAWPTHCNALQHTATQYNPLQHNATHCNTLLRTATHCNTMQYYATLVHMHGLTHSSNHLWQVALEKLHWTSPKSIKTRKSDSSVSRGTNSNRDFGFLSLYWPILVARFGGFRGCSICSGICRRVHSLSRSCATDIFSCREHILISRTHSRHSHVENTFPHSNANAFSCRKNIPFHMSKTQSHIEKNRLGLAFM